MEVRPDFADRMAALANGVPREVLANLLTRLMPTVEVSSRPPLGEPYVVPMRDPFTKAATRRKRRAKAFNRPYRVLEARAHRNHRDGTWTHAMVCAALEYSETGQAEAWLRENHPEFDHKVIDWRWLSEVVNYVTFDI